MRYEFIVGGGIPPTSGQEVIAAGLTPAGTLPVAIFPAVSTQSVQAFTVVFSESIVVGKRKKRSMHRGRGRMGNFGFFGVHGMGIFSYIYFFEYNFLHRGKNKGKNIIKCLRSIYT